MSGTVKFDESLLQSPSSITKCAKSGTECCYKVAHVLRSVSGLKSVSDFIT